MTPKQEQELQALAELPDEDIDFSDIPETLDWSGAKRGVFYRATQLQNARLVNANGGLPTTDTTKRGDDFSLR